MTIAILRTFGAVALGAVVLAACEDKETVARMDAEEARQVQEAKERILAATEPVDDVEEPQVQVAQVNQELVGPASVTGSVDWTAAREARVNGAITDAQVSVQNVGDNSELQVPVLLPSGIVQAQNARAPALITTDDGYFATYQTPLYDAIVNGSQQAYASGDGDATPSEDMQFTVSDGGAQLAFTRFGAAYLIEFECRQIDGGESCITEEQANEFADSLFVAQTR